MTSNIDTSQINANFPVQGQDNPSQGFRDNFSSIKFAFDTAANEITELQTQIFETTNTSLISQVAGLQMSSANTGTHLQVLDGQLSSLQLIVNTNTNNITILQNNVGNIPLFLSTYTGTVSANNLIVSGTTNLNDSSNITILGGTTGQVLTTDGSGHLYWSTIVVPPAISIQSQGTTLTNTATTLNFTGTGVSVVNTSGVETITISGSTGAFVQLGQFIVSDTITSSITFPSIINSYRDLQIRVSGQTSESGGASKLQLNFNNDYSQNYTYQYLVSQSTTVAGFSASTPGSAWAGCIGGTTSAGGCIINIMNYNDTTFNKMVKATGFTNGTIFDTSAIWLSTSSINTVTVSIVAGGNFFTSGTVVTLYGVGS